MRELLLEIWASIRRNKLRTFLTGFSVAWGIFMLVILLGSGNGLKNGTLSNFGSMAVNSVIINGGWTSQPYKGYDKWRRINITNRDLEILRTEFPEVDKVSARVQGPGQYNLSHGRDFLNNAAVVGSDPECREIMNVRVLDGRFLNDTDLRERRKVIVVDKTCGMSCFTVKVPSDSTSWSMEHRTASSAFSRWISSAPTHSPSSR